MLAGEHVNQLVRKFLNWADFLLRVFNLLSKNFEIVYNNFALKSIDFHIQ